MTRRTSNGCQNVKVLLHSYSDRSILHDADIENCTEFEGMHQNTAYFKLFVCVEYACFYRRVIFMLAVVPSAVILPDLIFI